MSLLRTRFLALSMIIAMSHVLAAQTLTVPQGPLTRNTVIKIQYCDPASAGQTVDITLDNADPILPQIMSVTLTLDKSGCATYTWTVPKSRDWQFVNVNGPGVPEESRRIS